MNASLIFVMVAIAIGGVAWVFIYPLLSGERNTERRMASVARKEPMQQRTPRSGQKSRREQVEGTLKQLEARQKASRRVPLSMRLSQAGLSWTPRRFMVISVSLGFVVFVVLMLTGVGLLPSLGIAFAAGGGLPFWALSFLKKRREAKFLETFPDAVDVIVRGIKAGLPLLDSLKLIATEAQEPVRSEFRSIIETQTIGIPIGEACLKLYEDMPLPEANFFAHRRVDPAARRRQSLRGARQPVARAARPQEDESQDQGDVDGSQGFRVHHRRAADRCDASRLHHQSAIHLAFVDRAARPHDAA